MGYEFRTIEGAAAQPLAPIRERTGPDIGQALQKLLPERLGRHRGHVTDPTTEPDPTRWETQVYYPL